MANRPRSSRPRLSRRAHSRAYWSVLLVAGMLVCVGCSSKTYLMPTPNAYTHPEWNPFADVPPALQGDTVSVMYVTDRVPTKQEPDHWEYGRDRSRSAAFGEAQVKIGKDQTWDELVQASRTGKRKDKLELTNISTNELGRFPQTPPSMILTNEQRAAAPSSDKPTGSAEEKLFLAELSRRLAATPRKEVFLYIHGFSNSFDNSVTTIAELWHFLGREGVPIAYSWPCGSGGVRQYMYTTLSGQFTNYHLKQTIRLIASCPDVKKINIIAHSRGTDVATTAVRELHIETRDIPGATAALKLGNCVLAAADMDVNVVVELNVTEQVGRAVDSVAIYICNKDKALAFSNWLSLGQMRLGDINPSIFTPQEVTSLRESKHLQFIDARVKSLGPFGHSYFHDNPAVSSDLMLFLRYNLPPGGDRGRPLAVTDSGFWQIENGYPGPNWKLPQSAEND